MDTLFFLGHTVSQNHRIHVASRVNWIAQGMPGQAGVHANAEALEGLRRAAGTLYIAGAARLSQN